MILQGEETFGKLLYPVDNSHSWDVDNKCDGHNVDGEYNGLAGTVTPYNQNKQVLVITKPFILNINVGIFEKRYEDVEFVDVMYGTRRYMVLNRFSTVPD